MEYQRAIYMCQMYNIYACTEGTGSVKTMCHFHVTTDDFDTEKIQ